MSEHICAWLIVLACIAFACAAASDTIGRMARECGVKRLVLSQFMARSLADLEGNLARPRECVAGDISLAREPACIKP